MTGAAGDNPDTAGTDPLIAVVAETLCPPTTGHREGPNPVYLASDGTLQPLLGATASDPTPAPPCAEHCTQAADVVAAVRAHQDTTRQHAAAQALRDAADAMDALTVVDGVEDKQHEQWNDCLRDYPHVQAPGNCLSPPDWLRVRADTLDTPADDAS